MPGLGQIALFLLAAVIAVPIARRLGLGSVLGYLAAGIILGPSVTGVVTEAEEILHFSEFGVVLLLFVIGLELKPQRLWVMRRQVFGLGGAQVLLTMALVAGGGMALGLAPPAAMVAGFALALSSTAFVLPILAERGEMQSLHGRKSFAILLFQDLAVIPLLALLPLFAGSKQEVLDWSAIGTGTATAIAVIGAIFFAGRYLIRHVFKIVAMTGVREVFIAAALLVVVGTASLMSLAGLSMSLGAFLAGVLLADSEYRHEIQADIEPFEGLLLGLFFMAVGMATDLGLLAAQPFTILGLALGLMAIKGGVIIALAKATRAKMADAVPVAFLLAQGGEFGFVLFSLATQNQIMDQKLAGILVVTVTLSMMFTPLAVKIMDRWIMPIFDRAPARPYDTIEDGGRPVIVAGFGRFGQIVCRVLGVKNIPFTALEASATQVDFVKKFGNQIYYGDASRLDLLRAAGAENARAFVLAIDDPEASVRTAEVVRKNFPNLPIYARARNRQHAYKLMDLGVRMLVRETYWSSLHLTRHVLEGMGVAAHEAKAAIDKFSSHDEATLEAQHAAHMDDAMLVQTAREAAAELRALFEQDDQDRARRQAAD